MKRNLTFLGIYFFALLEISTLISMVLALKYRNAYPPNLIIMPPFVIILGILTLKLKRLALKLNILLSPVIVVTYCSSFFALYDFVTQGYTVNMEELDWLVWIIIIIFLLIHLAFFNHPKTRALFK
jgi:hypothetical protein